MRGTQAITGLAVLLTIAGCQRTTSDGFYERPQAVQPVIAQPVPTVSSSQLPDPTTDASQFPEPPIRGTETAGLTDGGAAAATALDVTKQSMVGNWKVSSGASSCDMFLTLTNLGSGSRGGTRGCAGELTAMGSWEVSGKQVVLKDRNGGTIGRLYKTADTRFDGTTNSGQPLSLSR